MIAYRKGIDKLFSVGMRKAPIKSMQICVYTYYVGDVRKGGYGIDSGQE
jgi:hypothetical protein